MDTDIYNLCKLSNHCLNCHAHDRVTLMNTRCDIQISLLLKNLLFKTSSQNCSGWLIGLVTDPINPCSFPWVPAANFCSLSRAKKPVPFYLSKLITWKICTQQSTKVLRTEVKNKWERASASPTRTLII
jgi:hypothetical protein